MKKYVLDKKDRAILAVFCNNARLSYNQIARITHISKDRVRSRILAMQKEKYIVSYFPLINYTKLGMPLFNVYCKLGTIKYIDENHIKPLMINKNISSVTWLMGKFDLELQIMAKDKREVKDILRKSGFLDKIQEYKITTPGRPEVYSTTNLSAREIEKPTKDENQREFLDKKDIELINLLCLNARDRIIDLAYKLKLKEDEVRYRIKSLIKREIILGFHARTDKTFMGSTRYLTLIKVKNNLDKGEIASLKSMKNIFYLKRCVGGWDYLLRFHTASTKELVNTFYNLRNIFSKNLIDFKVHNILDIMKFNPTPALLSM